KRWPARIRRVLVPQRGALILVVELVGGLPLVAPFAERSVEPEPIFLDRAAKRDAGVVNVVEGVDALEPASDQVGTQVVAHQALVRVETRDAAGEAVAAFSRNHVDD